MCQYPKASGTRGLVYQPRLLPDCRSDPVPGEVGLGAWGIEPDCPKGFDVASHNLDFERSCQGHGSKVNFGM